MFGIETLSYKRFVRTTNKECSEVSIPINAMVRYSPWVPKYVPTENRFNLMARNSSNRIPAGFSKGVREPQAPSTAFPIS